MLRVAGESFELLASRCAYWPARRTLLLADVHLGKADALRKLGVPLPTLAILESQLRYLDQAIASSGAERLLVLGDLLHAPIGLTPQLIETVAAWRTRIPIALDLVPGNHDRRVDVVARAWNINELAPIYREGSLDFRHEPPDSQSGNSTSGDSPAFTWCGHLHPAIKLRSAADSVRLPCFHIRSAVGILPAFSRFTVGGPLDRADSDRIFAVVENQVMEIPNRVTTLG